MIFVYQFLHDQWDSHALVGKGSGVPCRSRDLGPGLRVGALGFGGSRGTSVCDLSREYSRDLGLEYSHPAGAVGIILIVDRLRNDLTPARRFVRASRAPVRLVRFSFVSSVRLGRSCRPCVSSVRPCVRSTDARKYL